MCLNSADFRLRLDATREGRSPPEAGRHGRPEGAANGGRRNLC